MSFATKFLGKIPLRVVLVVPFVLQLTAVVGLVGYLSFKNGQQAVNVLATQLMSEICARIEQNLHTYLETPHKVNQSNAAAISLGQLKVQDLPALERHFWQQLRIFDTITFVGLGLEQKDNLGAERLDDGSLTLRVSTKTSGYDFRTYSTDQLGNRLNLLNHKANFDPRTRPWYEAAVAAGKPTWSEIYPNTTGLTSYLGASMPFYDQQGKLQGVLLTNINLSQIGDFLRSLKIGKTGQSFIIERSGMLVATSTTEKPFRITKKEYGAQRLKAIESSNLLTKATAQYLAANLNSNKPIPTQQQLEFAIDNKRQFLRIVPFQDDKGLDWLIVVVVPESDFMEQISANTRTTILLCIAALLVAIVIGILISSWVIKPLNQLNFAVKEIALGQWDKTVDIERSDVVGQLAKSFNDMALQLKNSFDKLHEVIEKANQVGLKVTSSTQKIATAGKQLEATVTQQAVSTNEVKATATEIAATSGELAKTMEDIAQKAQATAAQASNSQASLSEIADAMHQLATATTLIATRLEIMNEKANNISSVVTSIAKVADQTNLISLNAAIEAEKAGEYGAGFAVVAKEVQWLADKATNSSQEIEEMVKEIQASVANGVREMDKFSQQVSHHIELVSRMSGQIASVISQVQSLTPQFELISHSMEGQFEGAQQISVAISHLSEASQQTVESLQQTNQVLEQLNDTALLLQGIISRKLDS